MKSWKVIYSVNNVIYAVHIRLFKRIAKVSKSDVIAGYDPTEREVGNNYVEGTGTHCSWSSHAYREKRHLQISWFLIEQRKAEG